MANNTVTTAAELSYEVSVYKVKAEVYEDWGWCLGRVQRVGGVVIGSCSVSASGFRWGAPSSSSGAGSSCSCKAPVLRQPMKGVWKLSITRLPSRPHPWDSFPVSPSCCLASTRLSTHPSCRPSIWHPPWASCYVFLALPLCFSHHWENSPRVKADLTLPLHLILSSKKCPNGHGSKQFPGF